MFAAVYPNLDAEEVAGAWREKNEKFSKTLELGLKELVRLESIEAPAAFKLYKSYRLFCEVIKKYESGARAIKLARDAFEEEFRKHQEISRAGQEKKFGGHGLTLDTGELKAGNEEELKKVGRLHIFSCKLTAQEIKGAEDLVNEKIKEERHVALLSKRSYNPPCVGIPGDRATASQGAASEENPDTHPAALKSLGIKKVQANGLP